MEGKKTGQEDERAPEKETIGARERPKVQSAPIERKRRSESDEMNLPQAPR